MVPSEQLKPCAELPESWKTEPGLQDPTEQAKAYSRPLDQESLPPILKQNLSVDGMMAMGWNHYRYSLYEIYRQSPTFWRTAVSWFIGEFEHTVCELGWAQTIDCPESSRHNDADKRLATLCWYVEGAIHAYSFYHDIERILKDWRAGDFTLERAHAHVVLEPPSRDEQELPCRACSKMIGPDGFAIDCFMLAGCVACSKSCANVAVRQELERHPELSRLYRESPERYDRSLKSPVDSLIKSWLLSLPREPYIRRASCIIPACSFCGRELEYVSVTGEVSREPCSHCGCRKWWMAEFPPPERTTVVTGPRFKPKVKRKVDGEH